MTVLLTLLIVNTIWTVFNLHLWQAHYTRTHAFNVLIREIQRYIKKNRSRPGLTQAYIARHVPELQEDIVIDIDSILETFTTNEAVNRYESPAEPVWASSDDVEEGSDSLDPSVFEDRW